MRANARWYCRAREAGILILTLWMLFLLSVLAVAVRAHVLGWVDLARREGGGSQAYYAARAGVAQALTMLAADTNAWDAATEPWANSPAALRDHACGEGRFTVWSVETLRDGRVCTNYGLTDESRRVDLNAADVRVLRALLQIGGGVDSNAAAPIVAGILARRRPEQNENRPARADRGGASGGAVRFGAVQELLLVEGMTDELFERLSADLTVCGGAQVNVNTASRATLLSVAWAAVGDLPDRQASAGLVDKVLQFRESGNIFTNRSRTEMVDSLDRYVKMTGPERAVFDRMVPMLTISASAFAGTVMGEWRRDPATRRSVRFVWDRAVGQMRAWHED